MAKSKKNMGVKENQTVAAAVPAAAASKRFQYSDFGGLAADSRIQVKMPESYRDHWVNAARKEKKSLSFVICELLKQKYGLPE